MKIRFISILVLAFGLTMVSCKEDKKEQTETTITEEVKSDAPKVAYEPTQEDINKAASVMAKLMLTKECSQFSSYLVTAELTDMLFYESGPYTVFAVTNDAIMGLGSDINKNLAQRAKVDSLATMLKGHIVAGNFDTVKLVQELKSGPVKLKTLAGTQLTITKKGSDLLVKDAQGKSATIGKSDIKGGNGVLHLVDAFLGER